MVYQFKKVETRNIKSEERITITKSYSIGFPVKFYQDNKIADFKYVVFYYDEINKAIGIQFTNDESERNKFSIIHSKKGFGGSVAVRSFFRAYNIDPMKYHARYEWKIEEQPGIGKLYVINLEERQNKA
jgi:hypothetical protein